MQISDLISATTRPHRPIGAYATAQQVASGQLIQLHATIICAAISFAADIRLSLPRANSSENTLRRKCATYNFVLRLISAVSFSKQIKIANVYA